MSRHLYRVTVVDPKRELVVWQEEVVASDETQVLLKAALPVEMRTNSDKYDFLFERVGAVRERKEPQKVHLVTEDEGEN